MKEQSVNISSGNQQNGLPAGPPGMTVQTDVICWAGTIVCLSVVIAPHYHLGSFHERHIGLTIVAYYEIALFQVTRHRPRVIALIFQSHLLKSGAATLMTSYSNCCNNTCTFFYLSLGRLASVFLKEHYNFVLPRSLLILEPSASCTY